MTQFQDSVPNGYLDAVEAFVNRSSGYRDLWDELIIEFPQDPAVNLLGAAIALEDGDHQLGALLVRFANDLLRTGSIDPALSAHTNLMTAYFTATPVSYETLLTHASRHPADRLVVNLLLPHADLAEPFEVSETAADVVRAASKFPPNKPWVLAEIASLRSRGGLARDSIRAARLGFRENNSYHQTSTFLRVLHTAGEFREVAKVGAAALGNPEIAYTSDQIRRLAFQIGFSQVCAGDTDAALTTAHSYLAPFAGPEFSWETPLLLAVIQKRDGSVRPETWPPVVLSTVTELTRKHRPFVYVAYAVGVAAAASAGVNGAAHLLEQIEKAAEPPPGQDLHVANALLAELVMGRQHAWSSGLVVNSIDIAPLMQSVCDGQTQVDMHALLFASTDMTVADSACLAFPQMPPKQFANTGIGRGLEMD